VTDSPRQHATALDEQGWAELRAGDWAAARRTFEEALAESETPERFEGLSWAAWWLDDAPTVFEAREQAYRLYRDRGEPASAARLATWLASDELDFRGAAAAASGWLRRATRLLEPLEPGPDHGWLAFHQGYLAYGAGDLPRSRELGRSAAEIGREFGVIDLEMLGLALEGGALVSSLHVDEGMACLDEATTIALEGEAAIPISGAWACCFLVSACMKVLDLERAVEWSDRISAFAERYGSRYMLAFCRAEYGSIDLARGRLQDAEAMLVAAVDDFSKSRPAWVGGPLIELAELRRRQGRGDEAIDLLDRAGTSRAAQLCRAHLALDRGRTLQATELLEQLGRRLPEIPELDRVPVLALLARAQAMDGRLDAAAESCSALRAIEQRVPTTWLRASLDLAEGRLAAARGENDEARVRLEDAVDRFDAVGLPFDTAQARAELASVLAALGRRDDAERQAAEAARELDAIGAMVSRDVPGSALRRLTRREREVVALLAEGMTNRQIASRLVISEHTVHRHVTSILRKLGAPSRAAAAAEAVRAGLLDPPRG
jgi:RNA polymerase sigma factor (sigma-70 family)